MKSILSFLLTLSLTTLYVACSKAYTLSPVPVHSATAVPSSVPSFTFTATIQFTNSNTPTFTMTNTVTRTFTIASSSTQTFTPTLTYSPSNTSTRTATFSPTTSNTPTNSFTRTLTFTPTITLTPTITDTFFPSYTPTITYTPTNTYTITPTYTRTATNTSTFSPTLTFTGTIATSTPTKTYTPAPTSYCSTPTSFGITSAGLYPAGPYAGTGIFWQTATLSTPATLTGLVFQSSANPNGGNIRVAIYDGSGHLKAESAPMVTTAGWNTFPMPYTYLLPDTYTLAFQVENVPSAPSGEDNVIAMGTTLGYTGYYAYGPFPTTLPAQAYSSSAAFIGFYAIYCPLPTWTNTPTPNATLYTPTFTPTLTPTPVINWLESTVAVSSSGGYYGQASVSFNNQMWSIAGTDHASGYDTINRNVYHSSDGITWTGENPGPPFTAREWAQSLVFNNLMWLMGGYNYYSDADVWSTPDGANWTEVTANAAFPGRNSFSAVVFNPYTGSSIDGAMWVIGGETGPMGSFVTTNDIWYSQDGANWTEATSNAAFSPRYAQSSVVFNNKMWVIGGYKATGGLTNEVWSSADGVNWTEVAANPAFPARDYFDCLVYNNKIWVISGIETYGAANDAWSSSDGVTWTEETNAANFQTRYMSSSVVFNNKMWVIAGTTGYNVLNDVWHYP